MCKHKPKFRIKNICSDLEKKIYSVNIVTSQLKCHLIVVYFY